MRFEIFESYSPNNALTQAQHNFLKEFVEDWEMLPSGLIEVKGNVNLEDFDYDPGRMPVKFSKVKGDFNANQALLTTLFGCPTEVGGDFDCSYSTIKTLSKAPGKVGGYFDCGYTEITSLKGCPEEVGGNFSCRACDHITSMQGAPKKVMGKFFDCSDCTSLISLEGMPIDFEGEVDVTGCTNLKSLKGLPHSSIFLTKEDFKGCDKLPKEEVLLALKSPKIFRLWLKSNLSLKEFKIRRRGQIKGASFGI